jgi:hypothetical protein
MNGPEEKKGLKKNHCPHPPEDNQDKNTAFPTHLIMIPHGID